ncbi:MAG TPA: NADH-ubiquinone oxidoreductase-F iron-sulfur binding region domain-containing protein [Polyangiaceae bacterium]|nr:NADH-ubiquinone oxidoreductase-F iron-sulfur binding region domain-containing protein [Polyangiaceae bacterium]
MKLQQWARRRAGQPAPQSAIELLLGGRRGSAANGYPQHWLDGVSSFYDYLDDDASERICTGTACRFARGAPAEGTPVHCLGRCYEAPVTNRERSGRIPRLSLVEQPVILRHLVEGTRPDPAGEYRALPDAATLLEAVVASGLRGRGGAGFPTGAKWRTARDTAAPDRYVVANGDEGDPGSFVDRLLLEEDPHAVLAGMLACARAIGARQGVVFIRREYPRAQAVMRDAIEWAKGFGYLGDFQVRVVSGAGSYVAGEETALLRAIEGARAEPSPKPPFPAERGLEGLPTVVQNVETLAAIPWVVERKQRADTKVVCVTGAVSRPCAVEIALGTPLSEVLERACGGAPPGRRWKMALVGGPMGRVLSAAAFSTPLSFEALPGMGHAGVHVFDDQVSARDLASHLFEFARSESCGNCAPCRIGTTQLASQKTATSLERLLTTIELGSLCGFGQGVPRPIRDLLRDFPQELLP